MSIVNEPLLPRGKQGAPKMSSSVDFIADLSIIPHIWQHGQGTSSWTHRELSWGVVDDHLLGVRRLLLVCHLYHVAHKIADNEGTCGL